MGHSWGGLVALAFALALPEAVERLVIVDGYAGDASRSRQVDAIAEREQAFDRVRSAPWFDAAIGAFGEDAATGPALDELFKACWPLYFADLSSRSRASITSDSGGRHAGTSTPCERGNQSHR